MSNSPFTADGLFQLVKSEKQAFDRFNTLVVRGITYSHIELLSFYNDYTHGQELYAVNDVYCLWSVDQLEALHVENNLANDARKLYFSDVLIMSYALFFKISDPHVEVWADYEKNGCIKLSDSIPDFLNGLKTNWDKTLHGIG